MSAQHRAAPWLISALRRVPPWLIGALLAVLAHRLLWGDLAGFTRKIDFNAALFEDFLGPYYAQGRSVLSNPVPVPGFLYSPGFALALTVFRGVAPEIAVGIWLAVLGCASLALIALPFVFGVRLRPVEAGIYFFLAGTSFPLVHGLYWGQVSAPLTALALLGALLTGRRSRLAASACLGAAAAVKGYPAWLMLVQLMRRDGRGFALSMMIAIALAVGLPALVLGPAETLAFVRTVAERLTEARAQTWVDAPARQFMPGVLARVLGLPELPGSLACTLLAAWALYIAARRVGRGELVLATAALCIALPLVLDPSWPHYFAWLPFAQVVLWHARPQIRVRVLALASAVLSSSLVVAWIGLPERALALGTLAWADLLLFVALVLADRAPPRGPAPPSVSGLCARRTTALDRRSAVDARAERCVVDQEP